MLDKDIIKNAIYESFLISIGIITITELKYLNINEFEIYNYLRLTFSITLSEIVIEFLESQDFIPLNPYNIIKHL